MICVTLISGDAPGSAEPPEAVNCTILYRSGMRKTSSRATTDGSQGGAHPHGAASCAATCDGGVAADEDIGVDVGLRVSSWGHLGIRALLAGGL